MRPTLIILAALSILLFPDNNAGVGVLRMPPAQEGNRIDQAGKRPDLGAKLSDVSQLKAATRKTSYRIGEMINIDLALLNSSGRTVYFRRPGNVEVYFSGMGHKREGGVKYMLREVIPTLETFALLNPNKMVTVSYQLLAGCDPRAFQQAKEQLSTTESKTLFDNSLFINWGDSCLPVKQPGTYTLNFEVNNWFVVVPADNTALQTGVGTLESNPLTIRIIR